MRKTTFAAIATGALILAGIVGWAISSNRPLQAKASTASEPQIDIFSMMARAKDLPADEFQDFTFVFPSAGPKTIDP